MLTRLSSLVSDAKTRQRCQEIIWPLVLDDIWDYAWVRLRNDQEFLIGKYATEDQLQKDMEC